MNTLDTESTGLSCPNCYRAFAFPIHAIGARAICPGCGEDLDSGFSETQGSMSNHNVAQTHSEEIRSASGHSSMVPESSKCMGTHSIYACPRCNSILKRKRFTPLYGYVMIALGFFLGAFGNPLLFIIYLAGFFVNKTKVICSDCKWAQIL